MYMEPSIDMEVGTSVMEPVNMDVDASMVDMQIVKSVGFPGHVHVSFVEKPADMPWRHATEYCTAQRALRKQYFNPDRRRQAKTNMFMKGCTCNEDACHWCANFAFTAAVLAAASGA